MGLVTLGLCVATWAKPMTLARRIRFYTLGALVTVVAIGNFERLGYPPVVPWLMIANTVLVATALIGCLELPRTSDESPLDVDSSDVGP